MEGYIQALIDINYIRLGKLRPNQCAENQYITRSIEELEGLMEFYKKSNEVN